MRSLELSDCLPKLKRGLVARVECVECVELAKAGSLVEVGRKERLAAAAEEEEATLASEVTLQTQKSR